MPTPAEAAPLTASSDRELKYGLPVARIGLARRILSAACRPDETYPSGRIWTIYYDTPRLASLREKINSDYLKLKIRLRWYAEHERPPSGPAFIEAKRRVGTRREKVRRVVPYAASELVQWSLDDPRLTTLPHLLRAQGVVLHGVWQPVVLIRYRRERYTEPVSGARVNLDSEITPLAVNSGFSSSFIPGPVQIAVVELKGWQEDLPFALRDLLPLGARKLSVSKLLAVHRHVTGASARSL